MSFKPIQVGDVVWVNFNNSQHTLCRNAVVKYMPCAVGDSWIFEDMDNGAVHHVSEGCTVTRTKETTT